jgi:GT2 family glycosyltransferase/glycosyltransferase involved in cell wall biosynthesis
LSGNSSRLNRQNELIHSLHKQLEAKERELADLKWLFEQFLESPSWRLTHPIRWLAKKFRLIRHRILGHSLTPAEDGPARPEADGVPTEKESGEVEVQSPFELKRLFTDLYRVQLQSFLTSNAILDLPQAENPEISVLLVLFNRAELTLACLRALAENHSERMEIIIVDNNSRDETTLLLDRLRGVRIIRNAENRNFLLAVNQAAKEARGDYVLLLNNDAQVLPGTLHCALKTIRSAPDIGAVGARLILLDGTLQEAGSIIWRDGSCLGYGRGDNPFAPMYMFRRNVDYCSGAFLLTPRRIWEELGGFDERFKPAYYDETDYCTRLWERQLRVVYEPNAVLLHYEFASSRSVSDATDLHREHQRVFVARHQNLLSTQLESDVNSILPARMKDRGSRRVLVIDDRVPHTWLGSGFPRARAILITLLKQDCFVTVYPLSEFNEDWSSVYTDMPPEIEFMMGYGLPLLEPFLRIRQSYYDTIVVSRPHNMKILKPLFEAHPGWFEEADIIYDAEAIYATRDVTFGQMTGTPLTAEEADRLLQGEIDLASAADCVLAVSGPDGETFLKHGIETVRIVGFSIPAAPTPRSFSGRNGFLFVGAIHEEASPNGDSMIWFLEEILPKIHAELGSDIPFTIAGVNKSERVKQLATSSVKIVGHVRDLTEIYDAARVFVAPTRYAAGIPHKVHEAAARGLPIVATPLLASQLGWEDGNPFLVGNDSDSFARKCIELHRNSALWEKLRNAGIERIRTECSVEVFEANLKDCLTRPGTGKHRRVLGV